jgi:hypothetical protein
MRVSLLLLSVLLLPLSGFAREEIRPSSAKENDYALIIYRVLFGVETIKEQLLYPLQPELDKYIAYTTADAQVAEITKIIDDAATRISSNQAFREQILYEYKAAFTEAELADYARWLESPLGRKLRRFELRNSLIYGPLLNHYFAPHAPRIQALLASAEESTKPAGLRTTTP